VRDTAVGVIKEPKTRGECYGRCRKVLNSVGRVCDPKPGRRTGASVAAEAGASRMAHTSTIEIQNLEESFYLVTEKCQMH